MSPLRSLYLVCLLVCLMPASALRASELTEQVDAVFAEYDSTRVPGCTLGVIGDGELVYTRGYGMASLDHGVPLGPRSVFRIASTSKQFTAFAIQLLVDQGDVDLDADVRTYLPELPEYDRSVTVRHLLNHTSGYRDYLALGYLSGVRDEDYYTDAEVLDLLTRQRELNFTPGAEHLYSNSGYFLLGQIVLRVTGKTLRKFAGERIFRPLEMRQTHFHDDHREIVPQRAIGYSPTDDGGFEIDLTTLEMIGDGGVFTSVEDLARWDANFYQPKAGSASTLERMHERGVLTDGEEIDYASGLVVTDYRGLRKVSHGGAFVGYRAQLIRFPDQRLSVICLCNRGDASPSRLAQKVADLYLAEHLAEEEAAATQAADEPAAVALSAAELDSFVGGYRPEGRLGVVRVEREGEGLAVVFSSRSRYEVRPLGATRFGGETRRSSFEVVFTDTGATFFFGDDPEGELYERVELVEPAAESVARLAGAYRCDELMSTIRLTPEGTGVRLTHQNPHKNQPEQPLTPTTVDTFELDGLTVQVDWSAEGEVSTIRLGVGRVRNIECVPVPDGGA